METGRREKREKKKQKLKKLKIVRESHGKEEPVLESRLRDKCKKKFL